MNIGDWSLILLLWGMPIYLVLRFNFAGVFLGLLIIWFLYLLMGFLGPPSPRMSTPTDRVLGHFISSCLYLLLWLFIYGAKVAIVALLTRARRPKENIRQEDCGA